MMRRTGIGLAELGQDARGRRWMHECDQPAGGAAPWAVVEQPKTHSGKAVERLLHIAHAVRDVVQAGAAFRQKAGDLRVGARAPQELDPRFAHLEHHSLDAV